MNRQNLASPTYQRVADELSALIASEQLRPGERLPSVRRLARQQGVSITTAIAALRRLENRGLIEARPQSGHFVRFRPGTLKAPQTSRPPARPRAVGVSALFARLIDPDPAAAPLGMAIPDRRWFPLARLQREVATAARLYPRSLDDYAHPFFGAESLRHQIARRYADIGCRLAEEEITITNGCMEAMNLALRVAAAPGDTIAIESPTYFGFLQIIEGLGMKALELPTHARDGLSVDALEAALSSKAGRTIKACVMISTFTNPLGATLPDTQKKRLVKLCSKHGVVLIEDDIYGDLQHSGARPKPAKAFDTDGTVILCSSFSKTLSPGARIGWVCGGRFTGDLRVTKYITSISSPLVLQEALAKILETGSYERHVLKLRRACADQTARMADRVTTYFPSGTRLSQPQGGFVLWLELPDEIDTVRLYERARRIGITFAPGPLFSASGRFTNCLRLNCGRVLTPDIEAAVAKLGRLVQSNSHK